MPGDSFQKTLEQLAAQSFELTILHRSQDEPDPSARYRLIARLPNKAVQKRRTADFIVCGDGSTVRAALYDLCAKMRDHHIFALTDAYSKAMEQLEQLE